VRNPVDPNTLDDRVDLIPALGTLALLWGVHDAELNLVVEARAGGVRKDNLGRRNGTLDSRGGASDRTAGSCSGNEGVQLSARLANNFGTRTVEVGVKVGRVLELVREEATGTILDCLAVRRGV